MISSTIQHKRARRETCLLKFAVEEAAERLGFIPTSNVVSWDSKAKEFVLTQYIHSPVRGRGEHKFKMNLIIEIGKSIADFYAERNRSYLNRTYVSRLIRPKFASKGGVKHDPNRSHGAELRLSPKAENSELPTVPIKPKKIFDMMAAIEKLPERI